MVKYTTCHVACHGCKTNESTWEWAISAAAMNMTIRCTAPFTLYVIKLNFTTSKLIYNMQIQQKKDKIVCRGEASSSGLGVPRINP